MASLINILVPVKAFLDEIDSLVKQYNMSLYVAYRDESGRRTVEGWQAPGIGAGANAFTGMPSITKHPWYRKPYGLI